MEGRPPVVMAISRQLGSGGACIGQAVARRTGVKYLDREILQRASALLGADDRDVEELEERAMSMWMRIATVCSLTPPDAPYAPPPLVGVHEDDVFQAEARIIREIAARTDAVIVGRAGSYVLRDQPGLISVFLHAPLAWRAARVAEQYHLANRADAEEMLQRSDRDRARFLQSLHGRPWLEASRYHICLDTAALGVDAAIDLLSQVMVSRLRASA